MSDVEAKAPPTSIERLRPLSPHLQIYRWSWTMAMSIAHRATGVALYAGTLLLAGWLVALASGPDAYATAQAVMNSIPGRLVLFLYTWTLFHHMLGGLRHFLWDMGLADGSPARHLVAQATLVGSIVLALIVWIGICLTR